MSPFGLFELLKTLLPTSDQPQSTPSSSATENPAPQPSEPSDFSANEPSSTPPSSPAKNNACADFLYRHEQRAQGVKQTKKRLD
jgi:hypothetical protein